MRDLLTQFAAGKIDFNELRAQTPVVAIEFEVDYSAEGDDDSLGALSPFIIDVDENTTTALIRVEYKIKKDDKTLRQLLEPYYFKDGVYDVESDKAREALVDNFAKIFERIVKKSNAAPLRVERRRRNVAKFA